MKHSEKYTTKKDIAEHTNPGRIKKQLTSNIPEQSSYTYNNILQNVMDSIDNPVFSLDRDLCYTSFNSKHASDMKLYYNVEIHIGDKFLDNLNNSKAGEKAKKNLLKVLCDGEIYTEESFSDINLPSFSCLEIIHNPIFNSVREITGVSVIARDITQQKRYEELIHKQRTEYRTIIDTVPSMIVLTSRDGKIIRINKTAASQHGKHPREMVGKTINDLFKDESIKVIIEHGKKVLDTGKPELGIKGKHYMKTGHFIYSQIDILPYIDNNGINVGLIYVIDDITERQKTIEQLLNLNRLYTFFSEINQIIVRSDNFDDLFHALCYAAVRTAGFRMAWIGLLDNETGRIKPVEHYGHEEGYLETITINSASGPMPLSTASRISEGKVTVIEDISEDPRMLPWREDTLKRRYLSLASIPLKPGGKFSGNFVLYSGNIEAFKYKEIDLLEQIGHDISFAMEKIDSTSHHRQTEKNNKLLAELLNNANDGILVFDENKNVIYVNDTNLRMYGYTREEFTSMSFEQLIVPEFIENEKNVMKTLDTRGEICFETAHYRKDGSIMPMEIHARKLEIEGSQYIIGIGSDITRRKKSEEQLLFDSEILNSATDAILVWDMNNNCVYANDTACNTSGYKHEDLIGKNLHDLLSHESYLDIINRVDKELLKNGEATFETHQISRYKSKIPSEVHTRIIKLGTSNYKVSISRDITERKQAQEKIQKSYKQIEKTLEGITRAIAATVELRDPYTAGHQLRVARLAEAIALEMDLSKEKARQIYTAGLIHDIGKLSLPAEILSKPGNLSNIEYTLIGTHPRAGYDILKSIDFAYPLAQWILEHHERLNGSGYPLKLSGEEITPEARILAVADVVEAMSSHRPYRPSLGIAAALEEISRNRKVLYDEKAVNACIRLFTEKQFKF